MKERSVEKKGHHITSDLASRSQKEGIRMQLSSFLVCLQRHPIQHCEIQEAGPDTHPARSSKAPLILRS